MTNPAFVETEPTAGTTAVTSGDATSATPTTSPEPTTTTVTSTTESNSVTSDTPPGTTTEDPATTGDLGTTDPNTSTGEEPALCELPDLFHDLAPLIRPVDSLDWNKSITAAQCIAQAGVKREGQLWIYPDGFGIKPGCDLKLEIPQLSPGLKFPMDWQLDDLQLPGYDGNCVVVEYKVHPGYEPCAISEVTVSKDNNPILYGRFSVAADVMLPGFVVGPEARGTCACPGCCGIAPDPDLYDMKIGQALYPELENGGSPEEVFLNNIKHLFVNLRSDVHPECQDEPKPPAPDWLHFDWVLVRPAG